LRETIGFNTNDEEAKWLNADNSHRTEGDDSQFGLLVGYWLSSYHKIRPSTLEALIRKAADTNIDYDALLNSTASDSDVSAAAFRVRAELLVGVPDKESPDDLIDLIEEALHKARSSHLDDPRNPKRWSAAFIVSVIRRCATELGLEGMNGEVPFGSNKLLKPSEIGAHRYYVLEAYHRMRNGITGTYHAFNAIERVPQVGDIIIQDRRHDIRMDDVITFDNIPFILATTINLHADIIVENSDSSNYVVTIGGNLGPNGGARGSVRRRHYPLDTNRHLIVNPDEQYVNVDDIDTLSSIKTLSTDSILAEHSTGRIFALLSPVQECHTSSCEEYGH